MAKNKSDRKKKAKAPKDSKSMTRTGRMIVRHEMFAQEIANGVTATDAYRIVYGQGNYSDEALHVMASKLRHKVDIRVREILAERAKTTDEERKECAKILMDIARANPKRLMYDDPKTGKSRMRSPQQLPDSIANAISDMNNNNGRVNYRFHGKVDAIRLLAQMNGWDSPKDINVNMTGTERIIRFGGFPQFMLDEDDGKE